MAIDLYLSIGQGVVGILLGMMMIQGLRPSLVRFFFILGAGFLWPFYLGYIWRRIKV